MARVAGEEWQAAQKRQLQGGTPVELAAKLALFLASDASNGLTGKLISAPHDTWQEWDPAQIAKAGWHTPGTTLRRIDPPYTASFHGGTSMSLRVGIVGCGLIGRKRANAIQASQTEKLVVVADVNAERASSMAGEFGCAATTEWQQAIAEYDLDVLIVSTINKFLAPISQAALDAGKHVLCEKPPGRNAAETQCMAEAAKRSGCVLKVGFNHRHHPAIWKAHELCAQGEIGSPMFIRAVYGHGGRPGYDKEWRADAELSGGGELLDQGVHVIDLCRWFMGDFAEVFAATSTTYHWDLGFFPELAGKKRQLEDNAFAILRTIDGRTAHIPHQLDTVEESFLLRSVWDKRVRPCRRLRRELWR